MQGNGQILDSGEFVPDFSDCIVIPVYDTKKKKYMETKYPSRAKKKRETQQLIDEEEYDDDFER